MQEGQKVPLCQVLAKVLCDTPTDRPIVSLRTVSLSIAPKMGLDPAPMTTIDALPKDPAWFMGPQILFVPTFLVLLLYFGFGKKSELGLHALQNTAATILVWALNIVAAILFRSDINAAVHSVYDFLSIPTLPPDFWRGHIWIGLIVAVLAKDFCDYMIHRLMHTRWIWPVHAAHHSDTHVNAFSSFRVHFFEPVLMVTNYLFVLSWLQLPEYLPLMVFMGMVLNMYVHLDLDWTHGPLRLVIASPRFHRWHHADVPEAHGKNLANVFPFYDVIFGTYYVPGPCTHKMGALESGLADKNPILIWIYPFQEWARLIRNALGTLAGRLGSRQPVDSERSTAE
jgi:sterol desaturase/sphingolipid hydroxylase (fatty acid hydroxylase superfamily)